MCVSSYTIIELAPFRVVFLWPSSLILVLLSAWLELLDWLLVPLYVLSKILETWLEVFLSFRKQEITRGKSEGIGRIWRYMGVSDCVLLWLMEPGAIYQILKFLKSN